MSKQKVKSAAKKHVKHVKKTKPASPAQPPIKHKKETPVAHVLAGMRFAKLYMWAAAAVLMASTVFWGVLGALIHQSNADQLVDSYLFESAKTFHGALFPDAHTFLLKWPLFVAMKYAGLSVWSFGVCTVLLALVTVVAFAFLLSRIERRPLVLGTWFLALASVLLLVPAQPYPGGLLPLNFAMITTRNIEYIFYLGSLVLVLRVRRWRDWRLAAAVALLAILAASDTLFIDMSLGGAAIMLVLFALRRASGQVILAARWLLVSLLAVLVAFGTHMLLRWIGITHISSNAGAGPFGFVHSMHDVALGSVYAVLGLFANFGANPAAQVSILRQVPHEVLKGLSSIGALAFAVNLALTLAGFYIVLRFVLRSFKKPVAQASDAKTPGVADGLSLMLIATTIVSLIMFVVSDHYYPVDARYLQIAVFAVFVVGVTYLRHYQWQPKRLMLAGLLLFVSVACGMAPAWHSYHIEKAAMNTVNTRNQMIVPILAGHHVDTLVGDYWRVMPVKLSTSGAVRTLPLSSCTQAQSILSSQTWQVDLRKQKFAYLLTLDGATLTGYSKCTLQQIITAYGRPDSSVLVAGSLNNPKEMVLFYDRGTDAAKQAAVKRPDSKTETVLPTPLSKLYPASCTSTTIMNIVAHQDDDLLFINPDTLHALRSGSCLRTIYVTAGDDGNGEAYWLSREKGAEAAYSAMLGLNNVWTQRTVELSTGQFLTIANPQHNQTVSLIFMRLPDGNVSGNGFASTHHATIARLAAEGIGSIRSVDGQSTYNLRQLIDALAAIMGAYSSAEIRTQSTVSGRGVRDHSDHSTVGNLAMAAYELYSAQKPGTTLKYYRGYAIRAEQQNVFDDDLAAKQAAFLAYAKYDGSVCQTEEECASSDNNYSAYLRREYETIR